MEMFLCQLFLPLDFLYHFYQVVQTRFFKNKGYERANEKQWFPARPSPAPEEESPWTPDASKPCSWP